MKRINMLIKENLLLIVIIFVMMTECDVSAAIFPTTGGAISNNEHSNSYDIWSNPVDSYLYENEDGTLSRFEHIYSQKNIDDVESLKIIWEKYDKNFQLLQSVEIPMELTMFGGFYNGEKYNYIVFGQENMNESDDVEVIRIVQYDKNFNRIGSASLYGANTQIPFEAGSCRMSEYGDMLYVRSCHTMYSSGAGLNHQANITIAMRQSTRTITDKHTDVANNAYGYVSHSLNQYIDCSDGKIVGVDQGEGNSSSSVVLQEYTLPAGEETFMKSSKTVTNQTMFKYGKKILHQNYTGVNVGGFEQSETHYMVVGNSASQDGTLTDACRNIFLSVVDKTQVGQVEQNVKWITNYAVSDGESVSCPQLLKVDDNTFVLMWEAWSNRRISSIESYYSNIFFDEDTFFTRQVQYVLLNGKGEVTSEVMSLYGSLSDCKPIYYNGKVTWYTTENTAPIFHTLNMDGTPDALSGEVVIKPLKEDYYVKVNAEQGVATYLFACEDLPSEYTFPEKVTLYGKEYVINEIAEEAFDNLECNSFTIGSNVEKIGKNTFSNCSFGTFIIRNERITEIPEGLFSYSKVNSLIFDCNGIKKIEAAIGMECEVNTLTLNCDNLEKIKADAFRTCLLTNITLNCKKLQKIGGRAFYANDIEKIDFSKCPALEEIGTSAFSDNKLKEIKIDSNKLKKIGVSAFDGNEKLKKVTIKASKLTSIGYGAFCGCDKLTTIQVKAKKLKKIGGFAFASCKKLKTIDIQAPKLKTIEMYAFANNPKLKKIKLTTTKLTNKSLQRMIFDNTNKKLIVYVPKKKVKAYTKYFKNKGNKTVKVKKG